MNKCIITKLNSLIDTLENLNTLKIPFTEKSTGMYLNEDSWFISYDGALFSETNNINTAVSNLSVSAQKLVYIFNSVYPNQATIITNLPKVTWDTDLKLDIFNFAKIKNYTNTINLCSILLPDLQILKKYFSDLIKVTVECILYNPTTNFIDVSEYIKNFSVNTINMQGNVKFHKLDFSDISVSKIMFSEQCDVDINLTSLLLNPKIKTLGYTSNLPKLSYPSTTLRDTNYPAVIITFNAAFVSSTDVDNYLINMAACSEFLDKSIYILTVRTSASDGAVATLKSKGVSVYINNVLQ